MFAKKSYERIFKMGNQKTFLDCFNLFLRCGYLFLLTYNIPFSVCSMAFHISRSFTYLGILLSSSEYRKSFVIQL
jgi:hypothetical protein